MKKSQRCRDVLFLSESMLAIVTMMAMHSTYAFGQEQPQVQTTESDQAQLVNNWAKATVGQLKLHNVAHDRPLQIKPDSLLRWSNPIVGDVYGDSYLWLDQGRPAAFLSIYALYSTAEGSRRLTFQSLSADEIRAERHGKVIWQPKASSMEFQALPNSPDPPERVSLQKIHMRRIAQQFSSQIAEQDNGERFRSLRLLAAPLHQYESPANDVESGQLFAFVDGTDPEVLLLVECELKDNNRRWIYAAVRQNHRRLRLLHNEELIWEAAALAPPFPNPKISDPLGEYYNTKWSNIAPNEN